MAFDECRTIYIHPETKEQKFNTKKVSENFSVNVGNFSFVWKLNLAILKFQNGTISWILTQFVLNFPTSTTFSFKKTVKEKNLNHFFT